MEMVEDEVEFSVPTEAEPSSPHQGRRLKRLKKAAVVSGMPPLQAPASVSGIVLSGSFEEAGFDVPDDCQGRSADGVSPAPRSDSLHEEVDLDDGLDPVFGDSYRFEESGGASMCDEVELEGSEGSKEGDVGWAGSANVMDGSDKKKSAKKRLNMEGGEAISSRTRTGSDDGSGEGIVKESGRKKKDLEKERKLYLEQLHAESQRLLRETRDASFRPSTVVEKPISSILEKIRRRKLEILKTSAVSDDTDRIFEASHPVVEPLMSESDIRQHNDEIEVLGGTSPKEETQKHDTQEKQETSDDCQQYDRISDLPNDYNDELQNKDEESPLLPARDVNSDISDDSSSDEEDFDKENVDPCPEKPVNVNLYRKNDLAKGFVDEEAEEEDDSDHDLMRFKENDEEGSEEDEDDDEVLDDLIATGFEEMPLDNEKRNELHQKWLQQQDATATDKVLRRLNCGKNQRDPLLVDDEKDDEEPSENSSQECPNDVIPATSIRQQSRKAKQMFALMFTDPEDAYMSSDDEESEQRLFRQRLLLEQTEEKSSILHSVEGEPSKEVFGLIRKLNTTVDKKMIARPATASLDMLIMGKNRNNSFKPTFVGRTTCHTVTSSHKHGSGAARSFVFGRDDSTSRSPTSSSENNSDVSQQNQPKKNATSKLRSSQPKPIGTKRKMEAEKPGASLIDILRRTSIHFDQQLQISRPNSDGMMTSEKQAARQFTAFKVNRKTSKRLTQEE